MGFLSTLGSFASTAGGGNVIGAGIAGIASLLGGLGQNKSQKDINATNLQIARETNANSLAIARENNAAQYKAMLDNNKWSRDTAIEMFNLENAYNTPEAQRQRLLAAGLNPAVVMNGSGSSVPANVSTPSAAGSTISPSMPSFVTPTLGAPPSVMLSAAALEAFAEASLARSCDLRTLNVCLRFDKIRGNSALARLLFVFVSMVSASFKRISASTSRPLRISRAEEVANLAISALYLLGKLDSSICFIIF